MTHRMHWLSHDLPPELQEESDELANEISVDEARAFCVSLLQDVGDLEMAELINEAFLENPVEEIEEIEEWEEED